MKKVHLPLLATYRFGLLLAAFSLAITSLMAQTTNWTGSSSNNWNTPGNWDNGVPTATLDAVISSTAAVQPTLSTTATAKSVEVKSGASLSISSTGSLTINDSRVLARPGNSLTYTTSFFNDGTVVTAGQLILGNTAPVGMIAIWNTGSFTNNGGEIRIDRATNQGIDNNAGTFTNTGTIVIGALASVGTQGIWNQVIFNNTGGSISIGQTTGEGLLNSGTLTNSATITIGASGNVGGAGISNTGAFSNVTGGSIQIDNTGSHAIRTDANSSFINASIVKIGSFSTVSGIGISNIGSFTNSLGGIININRTGNPGTGSGRDGVYNQGTFINSSTLTVGDIVFEAQDNIFNTGTFINTATGEIRADRAFGNGIWHNSGTFQNDGKVLIGSVANTGGSGILVYPGTSFSNNAGATIQLDRVGRGLTNVGTFTNAGQIRMGSIVPVQGDGMLNGNNTGIVPALFTNLAGGLVQIDQTAAGQNGITNETSTTFTNGGTVTVGTSGNLGGNGIANTGTFTNLICGIVRASAPVYNENGSFINDGLLTVNTLQKPIKLTGAILRVNSPAGIAGSYTYTTANFGPLITTVNLTANAVLVSDGTANLIQEGCNPPVNAAQLAGKIALVDRGTCNFSLKVYYAQQAGAIAVIVLNNANPIGTMAAGAFADQVTIPSVMVAQVDGQAIKAALSPGPVNISIYQNQENVTTTSLTNNGIIEYPQGNPIPNVTNHDLIVLPISSCSSTTFAPSLQIGDANSFSVGTTWYKDQALTQPAGTYNPATNTFTANDPVPGTNMTLYFSATDNDNGCTRTVSIVVSQQQPVAAAILSLSANTTSCPYRLQGVATGSAFVFTGPGGYVFSNVYRNLGTYSVEGLNVKLPGTYTLTVYAPNSCSTSTVSQSVTVTASQCP